MRNVIIMTFAILILAMATSAQDPNSIQPKKNEMKKLDKMVGHWKGSGWIQQGPKRETFTGTENVQSKLDGLAILVEGNFANPEGKVIHETLAVLSCNPAMTSYDFSTFLANGMGGKQEFKSVGDHYEWGFEVPKFGIIRYTIRLDDKTWSEIGEFSRDGGKTWMQNFEMKLDRVK